MSRLQQSGLIALALLLVVAVLGSLLGRGKVTEAAVAGSVVILEPGSQNEVVDLYSRRERLGAADFRRDPLPDPLDPRSLEPVLGDGDAAVASPLPPAPAAASPRQVRVAQGETLEGIAARELGDRRLWRLLASTNRISDPRAVRAGQLLMLPSEAALAASRAVTRPGAAAAPDAAAAGGAAQTEPAVLATATRSHLVAAGETVGEISQRYYGTAKLWRHILDANRLDDPRALPAGKTILIPAPPR